MWQSMKLTSVACIGSQHTTGSRCGTDQGSIVETRHTTELKVVAPDLLEKFSSVKCAIIMFSNRHESHATAIG